MGEALPPILYTLDQVATLCQVSKSTIEKAVKDGALRPLKIGKKLTRVHLDELERWLRTLAEGPAARDGVPLVRLQTQLLQKRTGTQ
jgi:DNA binding domain, excisionase family